jgi:hypothetical protein
VSSDADQNYCLLNTAWKNFGSKSDRLSASVYYGSTDGGKKDDHEGPSFKKNLCRDLILISLVSMARKDGRVVILKNTFLHVCPNEEFEEAECVKYDRRFSYDSLIRTGTEPSISNSAIDISFLPTPVKTHSEGSFLSDENATQTTVYDVQKPGRNDTHQTIHTGTHNPEPTTTVMVRNIPSRYLPAKLRADLDNAGFQRQYDFFYMPCDVLARVNLGYCFINFVDGESIPRFMQAFHENKFPRYRSNKLLQLSIAKIQGFQKNVDSLMSSSVVSLLPEEFKPVMLIDGILKSFSSPLRPKRTSQSY